jgi:DNA-binding beta-propeller fold protein YncE
MLKEGEAPMKKTIVGFVAVLIALMAMASAQNPPYKQVTKLLIGGDSGWDYITYDPDGNRLFIARDDVISVVDAADGKKLGEVPAKGAHGTALVPDKGLGFSSNGQAGTVTVFDAKTLAPKTDIKVGTGPDAIIYDKHSKKVIVMNGRTKDLMAIDPESLKVVATVPLGGKLEFAATDNDHVYVNVENTAEIAVVDSKTWKATKRWKLEGCEEPSGLAIDEETSHLFAVCGNSKMMVVDAKTGKVVAAVPTGERTDAAAFDPGLKLAFASNGKGTLTVVRQETGGAYKVAGNVPTGSGARTMALDPKTHRVYLPSAELGPPAKGERWPSVKPGTFKVLVYGPSQD